MATNDFLTGLTIFVKKFVFLHRYKREIYLTATVILIDVVAYRFHAIVFARDELIDTSVLGLSLSYSLCLALFSRQSRFYLSEFALDSQLIRYTSWGGFAAVDKKGRGEERRGFKDGGLVGAFSRLFSILRFVTLISFSRSSIANASPFSLDKSRRPGDHTALECRIKLWFD